MKEKKFAIAFIKYFLKIIWQNIKEKLFDYFLIQID